MAEEKTKKVRDEVQAKNDTLFSVEELLQKKEAPRWQYVAFRRFAGWLPGKVISEIEFETKWKEFQKSIGGTK